jgi:hypothetical protein
MSTHERERNVEGPVRFEPISAWNVNKGTAVENWECCRCLLDNTMTQSINNVQAHDQPMKIQFRIQGLRAIRAMGNFTFLQRGNHSAQRGAQKLVGFLEIPFATINTEPIFFSSNVEDINRAFDLSMSSKTTFEETCLS